ncbi:MAG TPA: MerR family transcriptional regulator [Stellaceae bacterium]|nr:MerR family transcriptional regulator [Stellaceae bacterium]
MTESLAPESRRTAKSAAAFRTISEVAQELQVPQHVLRFWESKFTQVKPLKRGGGRRYYRPEDVVLLRRIRQCLYQEGYTIKGVQRLLREGSLKSAAPAVVQAGEIALGLPGEAAERLPLRPPAHPPDLRAVVAELKEELLALRELLRRRGRR